MTLFDNKEIVPLCIIGNGFDLHHHLETRYSDFRSYLVKNGRDIFVKNMESFFQSEYIDEEGKAIFRLWSDLEGAIGDYDIELIFHELTDWIKIDYDHMTQSAARFEDSPDDYLSPLMDELPHLLVQWISQVSVHGISNHMILPDNSRYLSFNYTRVLEDVYHVPSDRILHIHGVVGGSDELIVGHQNTVDESEAFDENMPLYQEEANRRIIDIMNDRRKPSKAIIEKNRSFFNTLNDITDIYVYGHSYSPVDYVYFAEVQRSVSEETYWHLGCHGERDRDAAEKMMIELKVPIGKWGRMVF